MGLAHLNRCARRDSASTPNLVCSAHHVFYSVHRAGKRHTNADALSHDRCSQCGLVDEEEDETLPCDAVSHLMLLAWTEEEIKAQQSSDPGPTSDDQLAGDEYLPGQMS